MTRTTTSELVSQYLATGDWKQIEAYFNKSEFICHLGITISLDNPLAPKCTIEKISAFHLGGIGQDFINGAIIAAVLDLSLGLTGLQYSEKGHFATTNLNIDIAKPIKNGRFHAISTCNREIGNAIFSEATIYDCDNAPCVYATGKIRTAIKRTKPN